MLLSGGAVGAGVVVGAVVCINALTCGAGTSCSIEPTGAALESGEDGLLISELDQLVEPIVNEPGWPSLLQPLQPPVAPASRAHANTSICVE